MKVIGLERGPRLTTAGLQPARRVALLPAPGSAPEPQAPADHLAAECECARHADPGAELRQPGRRRHRALRRGIVAHARGRFPRALADHRALRRVGDPERLLARRLAVELCGSRAALRPRRIRARRVGQGGQPAGTRRSRAATCSRRRAGANFRCRHCSRIRARCLFDAGARKLGHHPFSTPRAILSQPYNGPAGLHLLRLLPGLRLPCRREVVDPGHQAAGGGRHRQFQARHRRHVLPRQQRQQRARHRRRRITVPTARTTRSRRRSSSWRPSSTTTRGCCCCRRRRSSRTASPIRAGRWASTSWRT